MSKLIKKLVSIATTLTVVVMLAGPAVPAKALTADELQAQIATLQAQLAALTAQLGTLSGGTTPTTGGTVPAACSGITFSRNVALGVSGSDVKCLQALLNTDATTLVASTGVGSAGSETMYFGGLTKAAVVKFQTKYASEILAVYGLSSGTGFVGSTTRAKLNAMLAGGTTGGTGGTGGTTPVGAGLTVELSSDNPASATIVADSTGATESAQSMIEVLKLKLTNGDSSEVKVTTMKFTREGISADSDVSQAYLYEGDTKLIDYQSFSSSVLTFNYSGGIITIPANSSKVVTLKVDLVNNADSGKTMKFTVAASTDVVSDSSSINGTFPIVGNTMATARASDLGQLTVATSTGPASTVDPQSDLNVFNFTLAGTDQILNVKRIKVTNIGSTAAADIKNFRLYDGATQIGSTVAEMDSDKTVTFDLSGSPLVIDKGITKIMRVKADISGGTNRTFQFGLQEMTDIVVYDTQYKIYIKPNKADTWVIFQHTASTINTGKLTLTRSADAPSGNVALAGTNVTIAKFDVKAEGEDVKVTAADINVYGSIGTTDLYQGKVLFDGAQKGTTDTILDSAASAGTANSFSFGNTFIIPADGVIHTLEVKADIKQGDGTAYSGGETFTVSVASMTATGKTSSASVSVSSATGYQLTIATGALAGTKNQAYSDWSSSNPTAVAGATGVLLGSYVITSGASEGADITAITMQWTTSTAASTCVQNMELYKGTKATGTKIGNTQSSVTKSTDYDFYPSPYISLSKSEQFTLNVYGDLLTHTGCSGQNVGSALLGTISGTGKTTNTSANSSGTVAGQASYVAASGRLDVNDAADTPVADMVVMGKTGVTLAKLKYSASTSPEDIQVTTLVVTTTLGDAAPTSSLRNITVSGDGLSASVASLSVAGVASFDLSANPWIIPAYSEKTLTISADIGTWQYASSGSSVAVGVATTTYKGAMSGTENHEIAKAAESAGNSHLVYKSRPTVSVTAAAPTLAGGTYTVFELTVTADSAGLVRLYGINLSASLFDYSTTSGDLSLQDIYLYDKDAYGTALNDRVGTATGTATTYNTTSTVSNADFGTDNDLASKTGNIKLYNNAGTFLKEISAGGSVTFQVVALIAGVDSTNDRITLTLDNLSTATDDNTNALVWGDDIDISISANKIKTIPSNSWALK